MTRYFRILALVALTSLLGACGSSPVTQFFTLKQSTGNATTAQIGGAPILVNAVRIPAVLDRREIVRATNSSRVTISSEHRWAAPFGSMARDVLTEDLSARLPRGTVLTSDEMNAGARKRDLLVDIQDFTAHADGRVTLDANWALLSGSSEGAPPHHEHIEISGYSVDVDSQVQAMSEALGALADRIVAGIAKKSRGNRA